MKPVVKSV